MPVHRHEPTDGHCVIRSMMKYNHHIHSENWKAIKADFIDYLKKEKKCVCAKCMKPYYKGFHVHHLNYNNFGIEKFEDLELFCPNCHNRKHGHKEKSYWGSYIRRIRRKKLVIG